VSKCVKGHFQTEKSRKRGQKQLKKIGMKLFRGTAKYLQKTLTFRRNTIVGVFFVYLLWEIFKQLITEVTCPLPFFKHVIEKWHPIIYNNFCYRIVTLGRLSFRITYDGGKIYE
jgi:hypothetical protein